jgi:hypothetical protein
MRLEQLHSLNDDETALLWYCINKIDPPVLAGVELEPAVFTSINHKHLLERLEKSRCQVKEEHHPLFDGLVAKLRL